MDIFCHAVIGASMGASFGRPILGALSAVVSDISIIKRKASPPILYDAMHSFLFIALVGMMTLHFSPVPFLAVASHVLLDSITHGPDWRPPLFWPFIHTRFGYGEEWEFFNSSWFRGFTFTVIWAIVWGANAHIN